MTARQYAVVLHPDDTLNIVAVGPFRSRDRAEAAKDRIAALDDDESRDELYLIPQVVLLSTVEDVLTEYGA